MTSQTTDPNVEYEYYDDDEVTSEGNVIATTTPQPEVIETATKQALNVSRRTTILSKLPHYTKADVVETTTTSIVRQAYNGSRRTTIFTNPQLYADATERYTTLPPVYTGSRRITILSNNNIPSVSSSSAAPVTTTSAAPSSSPTTLNPYNDNEIAATQPLNAYRRTSIIYNRSPIRTTTEAGIVEEDNEEEFSDNDANDNENEDEQTTTVLSPTTTRLSLSRTTRTSTTQATTTTEEPTTITTTTTTTTTPPPRPRTRRVNTRPSTRKYESINRLHDQKENPIRNDASTGNNQDNLFDNNVNNDDIKQEEFLYYRDRSGLHTSVTPKSTTAYRRPNAIIDLEHSENRKEFTQSSKRPTFATTERDDSYFSRRYARFLFRQRTG